MLLAGKTVSWQMVFVNDTGSQQKQTEGNDHSEVSAEQTSLVT